MDQRARAPLLCAYIGPMLIDFGLACHIGLDSAEWVARTVGTRKYRPYAHLQGLHPTLD